MLKLGIRRLSDFPLEASAQRFMFRSPNRVSYQLLRTAQPPSAHEIALFDHVMRQMQLSSGVYRTTVRHRFANLNPQIGALLAEHLPASSPLSVHALSVHDWAASSCLTSAEWAEVLLAQFPAATLTASDLTLYLLEANLPDGGVLIFEKDGAPLQYLKGPFVVRLVPPEPSLLPINSYLGARAKVQFARLAAQWQLPAAWLNHDLFTTPSLTQDGVVFRKIPIVHPEAATLASQNPRFHILRHSAFEALPSPVDVIRTMNIFNNAYFPPERLATGARAVWQSLRTGGIWIVGRTISEAPPIHEVSVFARTDSGFTLLSRIGPGSEIESLVLATIYPSSGYPTGYPAGFPA